MEKDSLWVDIVSDVVCPWCVVGYHQLCKAAEMIGKKLVIQWHPFQLNPDMPEDGENYISYLMAKYGMSRAHVLSNRIRITELGQAVGFAFHYNEQMRTYNSLRAHQLVASAENDGQRHQLVMSLFDAFFVKHVNISHADELIEIGERAGLNREIIAKNLEDKTFLPQVERDMKAWRELGVNGVPSFLFENTYFVSGAQGVERFSNILTQVSHAKNNSE
ncbi:MAG: DsbA family oxidoreductase [Alphaproteobacteria bacterium]|nr:DsbA family oxidoreductase [Alphaproteobacteria bacterium]